MNIKAFIAILVSFLVSSLGFILVAFNDDRIDIDLLLWHQADMSAGIALLLSFAIGGLFGLTVGIGFWGKVKQAAHIRQLNKQISQQKAELDQLRTSGLKD